MTTLRFNFGKYPVQIKDRILVEPDIMQPLSFGVKDIIVGIGLTPKMPSENNRPLLSLTIEKHIINNSKEFLVKLSITYTYRLDIEDDFTPTNEEIFYLIEIAVKDFAERFDDLIKNTRFQYHKIEVLDKSVWLKNIERSIDFWNDSIRHLKVNKNGKPI